MRPPLFRFSGPGRSRLRRACVAVVIASQALLSITSPVHAQLLPGMGDGGEMTASAERRLGDQIARELYRDPDFIDDPVLVDYVQGIWTRLLAAARTRGDLTPELDERFAWTPLLGRDRSINAFALPGGYLGLHLGLIAVTDSGDELATVLSHELSHVTQRHIARTMSKQSRQLPIMLAAMVLGMVAAAKSRSGDAGQAVVMGTQAMAMQNQLDFSRDMEREADRVGFGVMTQAGFAPEGAASMFEKLQYASRLNDNGSYPYLRSHPLNSERISDMQARFQFRDPALADPTANPGRSFAVVAPPLTMQHAMIAARARVLTRPGVDVLRQWVAAATPAGGDFARLSPPRQAGVLYAAVLSALELRETTAARMLAERLEPIARNDPATARLSRLLLVEVELAVGAAANAATLLGVQTPRERPELILAAQVAVALRKPEVLIVPLRDWVTAHPRDALAWHMLANLYGAQNDTIRAVRADAEANVAIFDYAAARDRLKAAQTLMSQGGSGAAVDHYEASMLDTRARTVESMWREQQEDKPLR
ncbi:MAG: M48 family metalloprotease [Janthinobacterium lividum]